jgi:glycosyltransferase involved in cell wall biosynthesis
MTRVVRAVRGFDPELVYMRGQLFYPPMLWLPAGAPLVVEVNTDDLKENELSSRIRAIYNARTRTFLLRRASALIFVTAELSHLPSFNRLPAPRSVISNGIDLGAYPQLPAGAQGSPRLVFVGTGDAPWHGVDKLCMLATIRTDWQIDIVGMRNPRAVSHPNITWHGPLERGDVLPILARADVGIGTLALHRKSMEEASSLKVREYLAVGLPVIYGCSDPDADGLGPYVLRIANTETNVIDEIDRIDAFVQASRGVRVPRNRVAHIDVAQKEQQRLALFEDLAGN